MENRSKIFERIREIVADVTGYDRDRISMETDLAGDVGVSGDDADDLFIEFDKAFDVDWDGLDLGIHFGGEGLFLPLTSDLNGHWAMHKSQPCLVSDVVLAVEVGRWPGTKRVLRPKLVRVIFSVGGATLVFILFGLVIASLGALFLHLVS